MQNTVFYLKKNKIAEQECTQPPVKRLTEHSTQGIIES